MAPSAQDRPWAPLLSLLRVLPSAWTVGWGAMPFSPQPPRSLPLTLPAEAPSWVSVLSGPSVSCHHQVESVSCLVFCIHIFSIVVKHTRFRTYHFSPGRTVPWRPYTRILVRPSPLSTLDFPVRPVTRLPRAVSSCI